jgi:hypothetical protein
MNTVDGVVLSLLALADLGILVYLRRRRARLLRVRRMYRSLSWAIRRDNAATLSTRRLHAAPRLLGQS